LKKLEGITLEGPTCAKRLVQNGTEAALELLEGKDDLDSLNLKAMLLLHMGRVDESLAVLSFQETELEAHDEPQTKC
jgi:hypothetical protein